MHILCIFVGGGLGAVARWLLSVGVEKLELRTHIHGFPAGTFACNLIGCFLIGCAFGKWGARWHPQWMFPLFITGFLGGFTTFSTFGKDTHQLLTEGFPGVAFAYVALSVILGLAAVWIGFRTCSGGL